MYIWSIQYAEMPAGLYGLRGVWMEHGWKDRMIDLISDYKHTLLCFSVIHGHIRGHIRGHRNWKKAPLFFVHYDTVNISKGHRLVSVFLHLSRLCDAIMNNHSKQQMLVQYWRNAGYTWKIFFWRVTLSLLRLQRLPTTKGSNDHMPIFIWQCTLPFKHKTL